MTVCYLIKRFHPIIGGAENQARALGRWMVAQGREIHVLTWRWDRSLPSTDRLDGMTIHRVDSLGDLCRFLWRMRHSLDVVHSHGSSGTFHELGAAWARCLGIPTVAKIATAGDVAGLQHRQWGWLRFRLLRWSTLRFVAISAEIRDELIRSGMAADRIVSLTNAVDLARFAPAERINIDKPVVLYAGRLVARKGVDVLLQAWPSVLKQYPQAQLWIAGKGGNEPDSVEESLKTQAAPIPSVRFLGTVTRIEEVLRHADVFVFPSRREGQPGALLEAMASGLPCVATKIGGVVDTIDHNRNGWLVSPDNPTELADGISNLLKDQSLASRLGATAHETVMQRYAIDTIGGQYVQLYQRLNTKEELKA